ncbi:MAG TPA: enoyl-CoA hydratase-related protein [Thermomonospora sp.]|nr:enoyl-CoA hydratase-related protein [Thermomonospora sp.]
MIELQRDGDVFVLRLDEGENRFAPAFLDEVLGALDTVEKAEGPKALVTVGAGKFYSNGLDLDWLGAHRDRFEEYLGRIHELYARLLALPAPTVAAVNGHAFAGGAMLVLAHDAAVMRSGRGYFCLPEVDLGMPFTAGMSALIQARLSPATAHEAMVTGRRYTAEEAVAERIVAQAVPEEEVLPAAVARAAGQAGKTGTSVARIRTDMYRGVLDALRGPVFAS